VRRSLLLVTALALHALPAAAQWTVKPGGWFMSHGFNVGTFPDRFSGVPGATRNELDKVDWGLYFIYGLAEGLSVGLGQGYARLEQQVGQQTLVSTGFGATGFFVMKRLAQGNGGILSIQPRVDLPLLFDTAQRPALGPIEPDAEVRLLYGNGFGLAGTRGFLSASAGYAPIRSGDSEIRYDLTVGIDAGPRVLLMGQAFNVAALADGGGISYSATKLGATAMFRLSRAIGITGGYYAGVSGKNTARERTVSVGVWITHDPDAPSAIGSTNNSP
jgi:hypothetical protein